MLEMRPCTEDGMHLRTNRCAISRFLGNRPIPPCLLSGGQVVPDCYLILTALGGDTLLHDSHIPVSEAAP
jgi:hypothetical protein